MKLNCIILKKINNNLFYRNIYTYNSRKYYSIISKINSESDISPISILTLSNLNDYNYIKSYRELLKNKGGIYSFVNILNNKRYIGSAKNLYIRLIEYINNKKSNAALQKAFSKYSLDKFNFCVYEYFTYHSKIISHKSLTNLETSYIKKIRFKHSV